MNAALLHFAEAIGNGFAESFCCRVCCQGWCPILLHRVAYISRVSDSEAAKDLVQETFLSALKNTDTFRGEISEKNWLFTILKNKIIDHYRSKARALIHSLDDHLDTANEFFDEEGNWKLSLRPRHWETDHSSNMEAKEFYEILENCKKKLHELQNLVFTMKYLDDMDSENICKELNISSSNYWVLVHRAKLQMRHCLEKNWFNPVQ